MIRWLKIHLIPHKGNNHRPHLLRREKIFIILSITLFIELIFLIEAFVLFPSANFLASILPAVLTELTNENRIKNQVDVLKINPLLVEAAELKAKDMAEKSYFAHESPEGRMPWSWLDEAGYNYTYAGENLAVNFLDSGDVLNAWLNSEKHWENILNSNFTEIGFGLAKGKYKNKEAIFIVQMLGKPAATLPLIKKAEAKEPILGHTEESPSRPEEPELRAATGKKIVPKSAPAKEVAGVSLEKENLQKTGVPFLKKLIATPRLTTSNILALILSVVTIALLLNIFIKIGVQHPDLILNGLFVILIIFSSLLVNKYLTLFQTKIL